MRKSISSIVLLEPAQTIGSQNPWVNYLIMIQKGLHITDIKSHTDYALGDTFAFGDYDTMMAYCRMYPDFEAICSEGAIVNPECILGWNVKRNNLIVHKHPFYPKLYRDVR